MTRIGALAGEFYDLTETEEKRKYIDNFARPQSYRCIMMKKKLIRTAYHEAGHAVIGYRFGHRFGTITIKPEPDKEREGCCRFLFNLDEPKHEILTLLAGYAAQKVYDPSDKSEPSITDYRRVWKLVESMPQGAYNKLLLEAEKVVSENFDQIAAVAEALLEYETLKDGAWTCIVDGIDSGTDWRQSKAWIVFIEYAQQQL